MVLKIILVIISLYAIICIGVYIFQKSLIFAPSKEIGSLPEYSNLKEISIKTEDGIILNAWYLDNKSDKTVLFCHGNAGNIYTNEKRLKILSDLRLNALLFDYRGYGKSGGKIDREEDLYKDSEAAYKYLIETGTSPKNIIIWGVSLGGAIAINLSQNKDIFATIIESTFYSMDEMARVQYPILPTSIILKFHFRSFEKIQNIISPILIFHSPNDEIIEISNGKRLFDLAKGRKEFIEIRGSHNGGFLRSYDAYIESLNKFLKLK